MAMFLRFFGRDTDRPDNTISARLGSVHPGATDGQGRPEREAGFRPDHRIRPQVPARGPQLGSEIEGRGGRLLLESNPLKGLKTPKQKNPARVLLTDAEYEALLEVSKEMDWRFRVALVIAHETGHRIGAIRQLRWSDIDMERRTIRWRAAHEKTGHEHRTPVTAEALAALEEARRQNPGIGDAPVFPAPGDPSKSVSRSRARTWWTKAQMLAGLEPKRGRGWHSLRRKFASDLMNQPLKVLCELGGWKTAQTVLQCYQQTLAGPYRFVPVSLTSFVGPVPAV